MKPLLLFFLLFTSICTYAVDYQVGPGQIYTNIGEVPWESMNPGDRVYIHYRNTPYYEKWVINVQATAAQPFSVIGVLGPNGERPIISGDGASTRTQLNYWNEERSIIKVGGSSVPADGIPSYIIIENLEIRSAHPNYSFIDDGGNTSTYSNNAASIHIEKADHLTIRNCVIHDSGNGIFSASQSNDLLLEKNYIYGNGIDGRFFEHNTYTESNGIIYQYNRFGPLRPGALGNNLKDRSAGLVVRYNWIAGGNRLLDLVDASNTDLNSHPDYRKTFVYGNILLEQDGGNNQVIHYGGDSGNVANYRKGKLYFYNNTLYSIRAGNTTLLRLSTHEEEADIRNNILYVTAAGSRLALLESSGRADIYHNLLKPGWVDSHSENFFGTINDDGTSVQTEAPGFQNPSANDFSLAAGSMAIDAGTDLHSEISAAYSLDWAYQPHQDQQPRTTMNLLDIGAYEFMSTSTATLSPLSSAGINLSPNPFRNTLQFSGDLPASGSAKVSITDLQGKQWFYGTLRPTLDLSSLPDGFFLLLIQSENNNFISRIIKQ